MASMVCGADSVMLAVVAARTDFFVAASGKKDRSSVVQEKLPAVEPATSTLFRLVVPVAGTCRLPSDVGWT